MPNQQNQNQNSNQSSSSSEAQNQQSQSASNSGAQNQNQNQNQNAATANESNGVENASTQGSATSTVATGSQQSHSSTYDKLGIDLTDDDFARKVADFIKSQAKPRPQPWSPNQPLPKNDDGNETSEAEVKEVEKRAILAETKVKLLEAGIATDYVDDALVLVNAKLAGDAKTEDVIGGLKEKFPSWFTSSNKGSNQIRGTGTSFQASQSGASSGSNANETSIGRRLAASKRQSKSKFSYFGNK